jgi:hypothetical protein
MQVLIDQDKIDLLVAYGKREYGTRIRKYFPNLSMPITVHGKMTSIVAPVQGSAEGVGIDYYLVQLPNHKEKGIAGYGWAQRRVKDGHHTFESYNDTFKTLPHFEGAAYKLPCYWLPIFHTMPLSNSHAKAVLTNFIEED